MLYSSNDVEQKEFSSSDFESMQNKLSQSIELLLDFKRLFTEIWAKNYDLKKEQIMTDKENNIFMAKIDELQNQIISLEKKIITSKEHLMSNINVLAEHLAWLEKKNMGFVDKVKFWNKPNNVAEKLKEINKNTNAKEATLFSLNEE